MHIHYRSRLNYFNKLSLYLNKLCYVLASLCSIFILEATVPPKKYFNHLWSRLSNVHCYVRHNNYVRLLTPLLPKWF